MNRASEPLTLTAVSITAAQRLYVKLAVNQLAVAILQDRRVPLPPGAACPAPNAKPPKGKGVTTQDYLTLYYAHIDAELALAEAAISGDMARAESLNYEARKLWGRLEEVRALLKEGNAAPVRVGHLTAYRVRLPAVTFVHPQYGPHARTPAHDLTVDTAGLEGDDLTIFQAFQRGWAGRGVWPLYAPHNRDGLLKVKNNEQAEDVRGVLERVMEQYRAYLPTVEPLESAEEVA